MTVDRQLHTYEPFPYTGDKSFHESPNYNWFNANVIDDMVGDNVKEKPGGFVEPFAKIPVEQRGNPTDWPSITHGDYRVYSKVKQGTYFTMEGNRSTPLTADEAMKKITGKIYKGNDGWTTDNKGFMCEYLGYYGATGGWYQKWNWQIYNTSNNRLASPVKGIMFQFRSPVENGFTAINDKVPNAGDPVGGNWDARGDQTAIDHIWGLWYHVPSAKYYCFEMTEWGNKHAPSDDPALNDAQDPFYHRYWFARRPQTETGGVIKEEYKIRHSLFNGAKIMIRCWCNEKIIEDCHFCGFAVQNETEKKAMSIRSHTNQWGYLTPVPFHIDRNTEGARVVLGGFASGGDYPLRTLTS